MPALPDNIERFLTRYIESVDQLDLFVLLFNSPQTEWSVAAASQVIHCPVAVAQEKLDRLAAHGLLAVSTTPEKHYRYSPSDDARHQEATEMVNFYRERPVTIIRRIYDLAAPPDTIRTFADAFKLNKEK